MTLGKSRSMFSFGYFANSLHLCPESASRKRRKGRFWYLDDLKAVDRKLEEIKVNNNALAAWTTEQLSLLEEVKGVPMPF